MNATFNPTLKNNLQNRYLNSLGKNPTKIYKYNKDNYIVSQISLTNHKIPTLFGIA